MGLLHGEITEAVIGAAFEVYRRLRYGFLEAVCKKAMEVEPTDRGWEVTFDPSSTVVHKGREVGECSADLLVRSKVLAELKVDRHCNRHDEAKLLNELAQRAMRWGS